MTEVGRTGPTASGIEAAEVMTQLAFCGRFAQGKQDFVPAHMRYSSAAEAVQGGYMPEQTALTNLLKEDELYRLQFAIVARYAISDGAMKTALAETWSYAPQSGRVA